MTVGAYVLEIDWDNDGTYVDANENVTANLLSISYRRGRDRPDPLTGRYRPGTLSARLLNTDGLYSPRNASGALYGSLKSGRRIRFRMTSPTATNRFTGRITKIRPAAGGLPYVDIEATDGLGFIERSKVRLPAIPQGLSGAAIEAVLDATLWPVGERAIDAGESTLRTFGLDSTPAPQALRKIENSELGFLFVDRDGDIIFRGRHDRVTGARLVSQVLFTDDPADTGDVFYDLGAAYDEPEDSVVNIAKARVRLFDDDTNGALLFASLLGFVQLWTSREALTIAPGESITVRPRINERDVYEPDDNSRHFYDHAVFWLLPSVIAEGAATWWGNYVRVSGVDPADIDLALIDQVDTLTGSYSHETALTLTNNGAGTAIIHSIGIGGLPRVWYAETDAISEDDTSRTEYGERTYPHPSELLFSSNDAQNQVEYITLIAGSPRLVTRIPVTANPYFADLMPLELSDRVTVTATQQLTQFGINAEDGFIEAIEERISDFREPIHEMVFEISAAAPELSMWTIEVSLLDGTDVLGY